ncbi:MAG: hypothetical protein HC782_03360 [Gammaproteobacteria bacterium]|nr:hypothetical protein [Gammaproteobacteria bacterium]
MIRDFPKNTVFTNRMTGIAAAKLATMLLMFVAMVLTIESWARRRQRFTETRGKPASRIKLNGLARGWPY